MPRYASSPFSCPFPQKLPVLPVAFLPFCSVSLNIPATVKSALSCACPLPCFPLGLLCLHASGQPCPQVTCAEVSLSSCIPATTISVLLLKWWFLSRKGALCAEFPDGSLPKLSVPKQVPYSSSGSRIGLTAQTLIVSSLLCLCLVNNIIQVLFKNKI